MTRRLVFVGALLALALAAEGCCPPFCRKPPPGPGPEKEQLSPPTVAAPLYECATAVGVSGFVPGAKIDVYTGGTTIIGSGTSDAPWGQNLPVSPTLVKGQVITAVQTFGGAMSPHSKPVTVESFFETHPGGLPKPVLDTPIHNCGGAIGVRNLAQGGLLEAFANSARVGSAAGCGAGQWVFAAPPFVTGQGVYATETLCTTTGPKSDLVTVTPEPTTLGPLTVGDVYEGGKYCNVWGIANGATVKVMNGAQQIAGHACSGGGQVFRLQPQPAQGDALTATQRLCQTASPPSPPVTVKPCSALPAPKLAPPCASDDAVTVVGFAPDARIRVFAGGAIVGDGGGPRVNLLRALQDGDLVTLTQSLGTCTSPASAPYRVRACSIPGYQPSWWNDGGTIQRWNNCYNYSNNKRTDTFAQPGAAAGVSLGLDDMHCDRVHAAAVADGIMPLPPGGKCPCTRDQIALVVWPDEDYHWYRLDAGGRWSHKPGRTQATNLDNSQNPISSPETADRGGYTEFCGYFCSCSDEAQGQGHENIQ